MFGLLHWQIPVTYQNTGLCRATVGRCTWPTMGFGTNMKPATVTHWYWEVQPDEELCTDEEQ